MASPLLYHGLPAAVPWPPRCCDCAAAARALRLAHCGSRTAARALRLARRRLAHCSSRSAARAVRLAHCTLARCGSRSAPLAPRLSLSAAHALAHSQAPKAPFGTPTPRLVPAPIDLPSISRSPHPNRLSGPRPPQQLSLAAPLCAASGLAIGLGPTDALFPPPQSPFMAPQPDFLPRSTAYAAAALVLLALCLHHSAIVMLIGTAVFGGATAELWAVWLARGATAPTPPPYHLAMPSSCADPIIHTAFLAIAWLVAVRAARSRERALPNGLELHRALRPQRPPPYPLTPDPLTPIPDLHPITPIPFPLSLFPYPFSPIPFPLSPIPSPLIPSPLIPSPLSPLPRACRSLGLPSPHGSHSDCPRLISPPSAEYESTTRARDEWQTGWDTRWHCAMSCS